MSTVEIVRGGIVESRHSVHVAVSDERGDLVASLGDERALTYYRSAAKPMQALPLVEEGVFESTDMSMAELALCCASHEGEAEHVAGVRSILAKAGAGESLLQCGAQAPFSDLAARSLIQAGREPERVHNNCSGKHAGMIALAKGLGCDPADYHAASHPVQRRMIDEVVRWTGIPADDIPTGVDGCGVVCFALVRPCPSGPGSVGSASSTGRRVTASCRSERTAGSHSRWRSTASATPRCRAGAQD